MSKHDLKEYKFAVDVCREFPAIKKQLDETYKVLYCNRHFTCVSHVLSAIEDSKIMLERQLTYYQGVLKNKGKE